MTKAAPLEIVVRGSPYELGYQHGTQARALIRAIYPYRLRQITEISGETEEQVLARAAIFEDPVMKHVPELYEELRGLAEGASLGFAQAFFLQVATEVSLGAGAGCSTIGLTQGMSEPTLAQNWDQPHESRGKQVILHVVPDDQPEILMFGHAGAVGYIGMNAAGLGHVGTQLYRSESEKGLPHYFINRKLLAYETVEQATAWLESVPIASTVNYMIGDASGALLDVELGGGRANRLPVEAVQVHTNHYLGPQFIASDGYREVLPDSLARLVRLQEMWARDEASDRLGIALADHVGYPSSVCRHEEPGGLVTTASIIMWLRSREMFIAYGQPCVTPFETYRMLEGKWNGGRERR